MHSILVQPPGWQPTTDSYKRILADLPEGLQIVGGNIKMSDRTWHLRVGPPGPQITDTATLTNGVAVSPSKLAAAYRILLEAGFLVVGRSGDEVTVVLSPDPLTSCFCRFLADALRLDTWEVAPLEPARWTRLDSVPQLAEVTVSMPRLGSEAPAKQLSDLATEFFGVEKDHRWLVKPSGRSWTFVQQKDPLAEVLVWTEHVETGGVKRVAVGTDENEATIWLGLLESNTLIAGLPGSGKSGAISSFLASVALLDKVALLGIDPKVVELTAWRPRFSVLAKNGNEALDLLDRLVAEMERRYVVLEQSGRKKLRESDLAEMPLLVLVVDELADLVSTGVTKEEKQNDVRRSSAIRRLIAKGRAAGISVLLATQKPSSDVVPTSLRDLVQQRVCFSTSTPEMTRTVLGPTPDGSGEAHRIPSALKGVGFVLAETERFPRRFRAWWVPDEDCAAMAKAASHLRVDLPWLSGPTTASPILPSDPDDLWGV